jgi:hypothetical protein
MPMGKVPVTITYEGHIGRTCGNSLHIFLYLYNFQMRGNNIFIDCVNVSHKHAEHTCE